LILQSTILISPKKYLIVYVLEIGIFLTYTLVINNQKREGD